MTTTILAADAAPALREPPPRPAAGARGVGDAGSSRAGLRAAGLYLVGLAVFVGALLWRYPRFFYVDDKQLQYLPVFRWLGQRANGAPPVIDPDQGMAGNFAADPQYGVFDPLHWLLHRLLLTTDDLALASWSLSVASLLVLGLGVCAVATEHRVQPLWAAAAALGGATSGWLLFVGASWWPMTWGTALLPWLWWGLAARSRWGAPVAALSACLLVSSGYPYVLPFAAAVVVAVVADRLVQDGRTGGARAAARSLLVRRVASPLLAAAGGALAGSCNLWVARELQDVTQRAGSAPVAEEGAFVPNLLDALLGGPTLFGQADGWWGSLLPLPVLATAWFAVPLLAVVRWRSAVRLPGAVAALAVTAFCALATQAPTEMGSFRFPIRYLADLQVFLPLLTVLLLRAGWALRPRRLALAAAVVVGQLLLAVTRAGELLEWHVAGAVIVLGCLAAVVLGRRAALRRPGRVAVAAVLLGSLALLPLLGAGAAVDGQRLRSVEPTSSLPYLGPHDSARWPSSVAEFGARAASPGLNATVIAWRGAGPELGLRAGIPLGSAALLSGTRPGYGYTSVGHGAWAERWCADYLGHVGMCQEAEGRLLETAPGTSLTWLEVMAKDDVLLWPSAPASLRERLVESGRWQEVEPLGRFTRLTRVRPSPGRITWSDAGVRAVAPVDVGLAVQTYDVTVAASSAQRLVLRDPWWPGYRATLDGVEVPTTALAGTVVEVELPAGSYAGRLRVEYRPAGLDAGLTWAAVGLVVALAGVLLGVPPRSRQRRAV